MEINNLIEEIRDYYYFLKTDNEMGKNPAIEPLVKLSEQLKQLAEIVRKTENAAYHAANTASCLANGIIPD